MSRHPLRFYLSFSRSERMGILGLFALVILAWFLPTLFPEPVPPQFEVAGPAFSPSVETYPAGRTGEAPRNHNGNLSPNIRLFPFDPNTLPESGWKSLGLREKTIRIILNFREKGARFSTPEDLSRIYGLQPGEYERLKPWIRIQPREKVARSKPSDEGGQVWWNQAGSYREKKTGPVGINTADTSQWIALPAIGSKLATRIVAYREKLGGFYQISQIKEVFGLADSVFQLIRPRLQPEPDLIKKINLNTVGLNDLKTHPYFRGNLARLLLAYRDQHGPFHSVDEVRKIATVTKEEFEKISPYLAF